MGVLRLQHQTTIQEWSPPILHLFAGCPNDPSVSGLSTLRRDLCRSWLVGRLATLDHQCIRHRFFRCFRKNSSRSEMVSSKSYGFGCEKMYCNCTHKGVSNYKGHDSWCNEAKVRTSWGWLSIPSFSGFDTYQCRIWIPLNSHQNFWTYMCFIWRPINLLTWHFSLYGRKL